jgi:hypothetical protein
MIWLIVFMARASWLIVFPTTILSGFPCLFYHFRGFGTGSIDKREILDLDNIQNGERYYRWWKDQNYRNSRVDPFNHREHIEGA